MTIDGEGGKIASEAGALIDKLMNGPSVARPHLLGHPSGPSPPNGGWFRVNSATLYHEGKFCLTDGVDD